MGAGAGAVAVGTRDGTDECPRNDSAVIHKPWRSLFVAVNLSALVGVRIRIDRLNTVPKPAPFGTGVSSLTSSTDCIVTAVIVSAAFLVS